VSADDLKPTADPMCTEQKVSFKMRDQPQYRKSEREGESGRGSWIDGTRPRYPDCAQNCQSMIESAEMIRVVVLSNRAECSCVFDWRQSKITTGMREKERDLISREKKR
jgi:hypothetical protein